MAEPSEIDYDTMIPNNVDLAHDRRVLRALERWHPGYVAVLDQVAVHIRAKEELPHRGGALGRMDSGDGNGVPPLSQQIRRRRRQDRRLRQNWEPSLN